MNQPTRIVLPLLILCSIPAPAQEQPGQRLASQGDPSRGIPACTTCHEQDGGGSESLGSARLAGQNSAYLQRQIAHFQSGLRENPLMSSWINLLTPSEIVAVGDYYAALQPATHASVPKGLVPQAGADLARFGDWQTRKLPGCVQCHGPNGSGVGEHFPALAGQPYSYLLNQLTAWRQGKRTGDPLGLMQHVASTLTEDEASLAAAYFAARPIAPDDLEVTTPSRDSSENLPSVGTTSTGIQPEAVPELADIPAGRSPDPQGYFMPPARSERPDGPFGEMVALGEAIFRQTDRHPESAPHVGNGQTCQNCHLDAGRLANASPMWAAWISYPAYRSKSDRVDTLTSRIQGCFTYSMNAQGSDSGVPPDANSETIVALLSYSYWLATGAPTGDRGIPGRGYPDIHEPADGYDAKRGGEVYREKCAICHGEDGAGARKDGVSVFPPLWGSESYNWGAGMHGIDTAASFIRHMMPLGGSIELSDQEAWDVSAFINSHERPQDPRFTGDLDETARLHHGGRYDLYGKPSPLDGHRLGAGTETGRR